MNINVKNKWIITTLNNICYQITDGTHKTPKYQDKGIRFISIKNIRPYKKINWNSYEKYISLEEHRKLIKRAKPEKDDILFPRIGTLGFAKRIDFNEEVSIFVGLGLLKPIKKYINPKYLEYYMNTSMINVLSNKKATGTGRKTLALEETRKIPFPLCSVTEQNRIVEKIEELFSDLDKATKELKKTQEQLKIYRQAVLKAAFEGKLTEEWRKNNPYEQDYSTVFTKRIEEVNRVKTRGDLPRRLPPINLKDLFDLPNGWQWVEAHKVCQSVRDGTHDTPKYVERGIPLITSKNLKAGKIAFNNVGYISEEDHKKIEERSGVESGNILFGMIGTIGNPVIVTKGKQFSIKNVGLFKQNPKLIFSKYLKWWLDSNVMVHILKDKDLIRGTTQKFISLGGLRVLPVPVPFVKEQEAIIQEIESRLSVCDKLEDTIQQSLKKIEYLRQSILKKAFEGKLVSQDPNDLPACELLKQIKIEKDKMSKNGK